MKVDQIGIAAVLALCVSLSASAQQPPPAPGAGQQTTPSFQYFFTAKDQAFEAYYDTTRKDLDEEGDKLVAVRMTKFSKAFRDWIRTNFPGGKSADYAVDTYSIDCQARTVGEHRLIWYDNGSAEMTDFDFGGALSKPERYSLKDNLMRKVCGLEE